MLNYDATRAAYVQAADGLVTLVDTIEPRQWEQPGLGVWDVRATVAHAARAFLTTTRFFEEPATEVTYASPGDYYRAVLGMPGIHESVAQRGIDSARDLGDDVPSTVRRWRDDAVAAVESSSGDDVGVVYGGSMPAHAYVPTRVVELVVHTIDIAVAIDVEAPDTPLAMQHAIATVAELADATAAVGILQAMLGRGTLVDGLDLFG